MTRTIFSLGKWLEITAGEDEVRIRILRRTVLCDWDRYVESGKDGDIRIAHRVWGIRGSRWLRVKKPTETYRVEREWWRDQQEFFREKRARIERGKELDPLMMTPQQRHEATAKVAAKMKWSDTFVEAMTKPLALQALENGGQVRSLIPIGGDGISHNFSLSPEEMKKLEGMTVGDFMKARENNTNEYLSAEGLDHGA
jgi:hypothetical protein